MVGIYHIIKWMQTFAHSLGGFILKKRQPEAAR
jgi:hypothetical protein